MRFSIGGAFERTSPPFFLQSPQRYKYGMLEQKLVDNCQVEYPDYWLARGNPWEVERLDVQYLSLIHI